MYQHILIPTDGSPAASSALHAILAFARDAGARVTGLHVLPEFHVFTYKPDMLEETQAAYLRDSAAHGARVLAMLEEQAREMGVPCETTLRRSDRPHEVIVATAREHRCDLIAMATHGHTGLKGMMLGSETHKVLLQSSVPVLVFRTGE